MVLLMDQSRSVLPLRSAKAFESCGVKRRAPWTGFPFKLTRTSSFRPTRTDKWKATSVSVYSWSDQLHLPDLYYGLFLTKTTLGLQATLPMTSTRNGLIRNVSLFLSAFCQNLDRTTFWKVGFKPFLLVVPCCSVQRLVYYEPTFPWNRLKTNLKRYSFPRSSFSREEDPGWVWWLVNKPACAFVWMEIKHFPLYIWVTWIRTKINVKWPQAGSFGRGKSLGTSLIWQ